MDAPRSPPPADTASRVLATLGLERDEGEEGFGGCSCTQVAPCLGAVRLRRDQRGELN
jgi:hypothetical protein